MLKSWIIKINYKNNVPNNHPQKYNYTQYYAQVAIISRGENWPLLTRVKPSSSNSGDKSNTPALTTWTTWPSPYF